MTEKQFFSSLNVKLNDQQRSAVLSVDGPFLLLAVPGSGKTTTLVTRLGYMIKVRNISPSNILTVTYTVAASKDIRSRFAQLFDENLANELIIGTINGICARIIHSYARALGKETFKLLDNEKYASSLLSALYLKETGEYASDAELKSMAASITYIKNMMLENEELIKYEANVGLPIISIYKGYCHELKLKSLMDFDDQMVYAYKLLKSDKRLLNHFRGLYPYICVDEAQDTSKIQHKIIELLSKSNENLFMVGDEDQSIYGFRAAYPDALLHFQDNHANANVLLMEENFRSDANIVKAADRLIKNNKIRHEKSMKASKSATFPIEIINVKKRSDQYDCILIEAKNINKETAVLFRDNEMGIPLIDRFEMEGIPYTLKSGDITFFTNRFVKDIINILKFSQDYMDTHLFIQFYFKLNLYMKKKTASAIYEYSKKENVSVFETVLHVCTEKSDIKNMAVFKKQLNKLKACKPDKAIDYILEKLGYIEYLNKCGADKGKIDVLKDIASRTNTITDFFERLDFLRNIYRNGVLNGQSKIILSTIHSSKGLEYDQVYLLDVCDGLFPSEAHPINKEESLRLEEERRLFYVAITRAKNVLHIFNTGPSIFRDEVMSEKTS